jgi:hypothetical protein
MGDVMNKQSNKSNNAKKDESKSMNEDLQKQIYQKK